MKKTLLITVGTILALLIIGVWIYLFMFGVPKNNSEIFTNFGIGNTVEQITTETTAVDVSPTTEAGEKQTLKQLTTRPVAGASFDETGIRYVEQGTGHIYQINLTSGKETLLSGTTIPGARESVFSQDGKYVTITALVNGQQKSLAGEVPETQGTNANIFEGVVLPQGSSNISFSSASGTILYTIRENTGSIGYSYNLNTEKKAQLFSIPLRDIRTLWGKDTYVYTTPTAYQTGYLYKVVKNELVHTVKGGEGLTAFLYNSNPLVTTANSETASSIYVLNGETILQPLILISEKCAGGNNLLYCAIPSNSLKGHAFPDDWYKGAVSYSDILWQVDPTIGKTRVLSNFLEDSGRQIDVSKIGISMNGMYIYFVNKNDNTLWMFDTTI